MTLFPTTVLKPKPKLPTRDKRPQLCIPTGAPRLVESPTDRSARAPAEAWGALLDVVRRSSAARLALLSGRAGNDRISCPWERLAACAVSCRCGGAGTVTVEFLRGHYANLAAEIATFARPTPVRRSP